MQRNHLVWRLLQMFRFDHVAVEKWLNVGCFESCTP